MSDASTTDSNPARDEANRKVDEWIDKLAELLHGEDVQVAVAALAFSAAFHALNVAPEFKVALAEQWRRASEMGAGLAQRARAVVEASPSPTIH